MFFFKKKIAVWALVSSVLQLPTVSIFYCTFFSAPLFTNHKIGVYYYCYEAVKAVFEKAKGAGKPMSTPESMLSGALAGCAVVLATHPIWTINVSNISKVWAKKKVLGFKCSLSFFIQTRLTVKKGVEGEEKAAKASVLSVGAQILKKEGLAGLYAGVGAALVLVINPIIQYTVFEQVKNKVSKTKTPGNLDFFLMGALSKLCATAITYPYM